MAATVQYKYDGKELDDNLAQFGEQINKTITLTTDFAGDRGKSAMKLKAPWTDQTGNARAGLDVHVDHSGVGAIGFTQHLLTFLHGVDYGIWLEIANNGKFQIIMPTVVQVAQETMNAFKDMFSKLGLPPELKIDIDLSGPGRQGSSQGPTVKTEKQARRTKRTAATNTTRTTRRS